MPREKNNRRGTCIRLDEGNDAWLDEEATRTGKSRSDLVNAAIQDAREWRAKVDAMYAANTDQIDMFIDEVRNIHAERKMEHAAQIMLLEEVKNLIENHCDITKS